MKNIVRNTFCIVSIALLQPPTHSALKYIGGKLSRSLLSPQGRYALSCRFSRKPEAERLEQLNAEMAAYRSAQQEERIAREKQEIEAAKEQPKIPLFVSAGRVAEAAGASGIFTLAQIAAHNSHNLYYHASACWQLPDLQHINTMTALCFCSTLAAAYVHEQLTIPAQLVPNKEPELVKPIEQIKNEQTKKRPQAKNR